MRPRLFRDRRLPLALLAATGSLLAPAALAAIDPHKVANEEEKAFFNAEVLPILEDKCFRCHGGEEKIKGGFRITSREGLIRGGEYGAGLDFEHPEKSLLLEMVSWKDGDHEMPPKNKLPDESISVLERWIAMGAPYDPEKEIAGGAHDVEVFAITDEDRQWWAYRPVERPATAAAGAAAIDELLGRRLKEAGLEPNPAAPPRTLVRRAFYNLIGLPPSYDELNTWEARLQNDGEAGLAALIDDLLARPQYGEKWARHWLDLVRYAETNGFERDNPKPHIWKYRDYVVGAFNEDKPYDRFVLEQLAGDELDDPDYDALVATGYHRLMQWDDEPADGLQHKYDVLDDNVRTTSETFLAITIGCARCHDHKADPISQKDYYQFMSFFHGVTNYSTQGSILRWADEERIRGLQAERDTKVDHLQEEIAKFDTFLIEAAGTAGVKIPTRGGKGRVLVDDAKGEQQWWFTTKEPDPAWSGIGFKDKSWTRVYKGGFGAKGTPGATINTEWKTKDIWIRTTFGLKNLPSALDLQLFHDEDVEVYLNGQKILEERGHNGKYENFSLDVEALAHLQTGQNYLALHCRQTTGGQFVDLKLVEPTGEAAHDLLALSKKFPQELNEALKPHQVHVGQYHQKINELKKVKETPIGDAINGVLESGQQPPPLHVHIRGSAHAKGDPVEAAFPTVLGDAAAAGTPAAIPASYLGEKTSGRRRALAEWIASPENPLTSRTIVNRLWQHHFGRGICRSSSDFGRLGEKPTHPELIDWLAAEIVERGWSLKEMHRLIMRTKAWRMGSEADQLSYKEDPQNNLFWRYDMRRLTAEELRDSLLTASGQLTLEVGGEPASPPIPQEVLATSSKPGSVWRGGKPGDAGRRSLYVHVKRSLREPFLFDFDAPDTDIGVASRFTTTVPTQALGMLNSQFVNDQAAALAEAASTGSDPITAAFQRALSRDPTPAEHEHLSGLHKEFGGDRDALNDLCLLILNLNEFAYLD